MEARTPVLAFKVLAFTTLAVVLSGGCNNGDSTEQPSSGGAGGAGGVSASGGSSASGGTPGSGGSSAKGGTTGSGGSSAAGGSSATGGSSAAGGNTGRGGSQVTGGSTGSGGSATGGATATGGSKATGGSGAGGVTGAGGTGPGGTGGSGSGGTTAAGGTTGTGGSGLPDGGARDGSTPDGSAPEAGGGDTGSTGFDPCPATGACKILPLGDSITWGIGYDGSYRVKLFANTITDKKTITYVGKMSNGPSTVSGVSFPKANEGHSGWTIQQIDDIVTGKSTDANYKGKKLIVDLAPHIVLLHIGTNDMYQTPSGADTRLGALIDKILTDAPDALLVVSNIIPFPQGASAVSTYNKAVPGVVQQRATAGKHILFVDQFANFPTSELGDGVHPNQQGYERMAGVWYTAIKSYLH